MIKIQEDQSPRVCQGHIYKNVNMIERLTENGGEVTYSIITFPLVIVLSQDCDLMQDFKFRWGDKHGKSEDKYLFSVLVAPLYVAEQVYQGEHLKLLGMNMEPINKEKTPGKNLRNNETPRYYYLDFPVDSGLSASVIDFKHYFSVNVEYLKSIRETNFVCKISELYRESISLRFANFLARIGLPDDQDQILIQNQV